MFEFVNVDLKVPEAEPVNQDGVRFYPIPGADKYYPSVTSITSFKNAQFFAQWRRRIGEQEAIESLLEPHREALPFTQSQKIISKEN